MNATNEAGVQFDGIDTMEIGRQVEGAWVRIDGVSFQFTRNDDGEVEVDAYIDSDRSGDPVQTMKVATVIRHRVTVTVEVDIDTTAGEASEPGNVIMAAVEAVRDGEGVIVAHEIVK